jgi:hypothetical protein
VIPAIHLFDDGLRSADPTRGLGFAVVLAEYWLIAALEVERRMRSAALQTPRGSEAKEVLTNLSVQNATMPRL